MWRIFSDTTRGTGVGLWFTTRHATPRLRRQYLLPCVKGLNPRPSTNHRSQPWLSPAPATILSDIGRNAGSRSNTVDRVEVLCPNRHEIGNFLNARSSRTISWLLLRRQVLVALAYRAGNKHLELHRDDISSIAAERTPQSAGSAVDHIRARHLERA